MTRTATDFFFSNMGRFELLEHDQIEALANIVQAWQQHPQGPDAAPTLVQLKGKAARDKMVRHNLRLIVHIWRKTYSDRLPSHHPGLADALQSAAIDLTRAAEKYQPAKGKFSTYATPWIHKGLKGYLAGEDRLVRIPTNNVHLIRAAIAIDSQARAEGRRPLTAVELVAELKKTRRNVPTAETLAEWLSAYMRTDAISYDAPTNGSNQDENRTLCDLIADESTVDIDDDMDAVRRAVDFLNHQERVVITRRFLSKTVAKMKEVGDELNISESQVQVIERRAISAIRNLARVD